MTATNMCSNFGQISVVSGEVPPLLKHLTGCGLHGYSHAIFLYSCLFITNFLIHLLSGSAVAFPTGLVPVSK